MEKRKTIERKFSLNCFIQKAMLSKNAFMINEALNGIPLSTAVHSGSHGNYNNIIKNYLTNWNNANPNASPDQAYSYVMSIIQKAKTAIQNNPNIKINDLTF
ncbi:AHH domain-containing protein [Epilithonimonas caeni]|uniref:AHH domain-containing protein n=1 Tax=Epilithonimonas caeni TaxID=365343 RepID=UPI00048158D5|nr:AHH domain-containing protein [Epilithonimonas caeni]